MFIFSIIFDIIKSVFIIFFDCLLNRASSFDQIFIFFVLQINAFLDSPTLDNVERYCKRKDIDFEYFKSLFQYMLYKYSRGINLKVVEDPRKEQ